ncbi:MULTISPECIES: NAD(P)-dependent oxidoreductase [unclassified Streptomyces]|uniref:NAD(P)-dependent oxidoreductase n=1 Tax=unclassified Streptomyces TaxID=2593676 RepID=UPI002DDC49E3|nr:MULTISPECIES: NAD(P)-dependent oxidoreductase [unclassified Streptomyces]WSD28534.1 hypothetical protein OHA26_36490 [Streptomyces sp. NBC_01751]
MSQAVVAILSMPLARQTRRPVGANFRASMKDGALLVNAARGAAGHSRALLR